MTAKRYRRAPSGCRGATWSSALAGPPPGSLLSGFWGVVPWSARARATSSSWSLRARLADGSERRRRARRRPDRRALCAPLELEPAGARAEPFVCICMATHEPSLRAVPPQVESLRAQTHRNWVCVVSDDCTSASRFAAIERELRGDPRFVVSRSPSGSASTELRARAVVRAGAADLRGARRPGRPLGGDKLETLLRAIGDAQLVY